MYDAILIPGGGLDDKGDVTLWTKKRLDKASEIYNGECLITLSAGTTHKPHPIRNGRPVYESVAMAKYLMNKGIPKEKILAEATSLDTIGNAYFARVIYTEFRQLRDLCIITSKFHMSRTREIFEWIFNLEPLNGKYSMKFIESEDNGIDEESLKARYEREKQSLEKLKITKSRIKNMKGLNEWLFKEHTAYSLSKENEEKLIDKLLETY